MEHHVENTTIEENTNGEEVVAMKREHFIQPKSELAVEAPKGSFIEITDVKGQQVVDFFAVKKGIPEEFLSEGVTIDCNKHLKVHIGDSIYSILYNEMFSIVKDNIGEHDLLHPNCRSALHTS